MNINVWDAVSNENDNIRHVGTVSICSVKDLRTPDSECTGCVCPSAKISNVSDSVLQRRYISEIGEVEVQRCSVTLM